MGPIEAVRRLNRARLTARGERRLAAAAARAPLYLDPEEYRGREVAIVGPAAPVEAELAADPLPAGTAVVRMNRGLLMAAENPGLYGARTEVLVHNLNFDGPRGTGPLPEDLLRAQGVRHLLYPHAAPRKIRAALMDRHAAMAAGPGPDLRLPPQAVYAALETALGGQTPTAGAVAIAAFLAAPLAGLRIYGFTFFTTAYAPGYNPAVASAADAAVWARASGLHDPAREGRALAAMLAAPRPFPVRLGAGVQAALARLRAP